MTDKLQSHWDLYKKIEALQAENIKVWSKVSVAEYRTEQLLKENEILYKALESLVDIIVSDYDPKPWEIDPVNPETFPEIIKARQLLARRP